MTDRFDPHDRLLDAAFAFLLPWRAITAPLSIGIDLVPREGPALLVGNHTLYGLLDTPVLYDELRRRRGVYPRALGDHLHFRVPLWRDVLQRCGAVDGTRENARALLDAGAHVLVFPGGGREVAKRKGERNKLVWQRRTGFARLAIEAGVPIVPFAALGAEDMLDVVADADDYLASPIGPLLKKIGRTDALLPLVRGVGNTPLPRPARLYFRFLPPVDPSAFPSTRDKGQAAWQLRERVRGLIEGALRELEDVQREDPLRFGRPRVVGERLARRT